VDSESSFFIRHEFLIRRLHSLSGLAPVGAFLCVHLLTNASVVGGSEIFQQNVDRIHALGPLLPVVEWTFIFLPIIFHAVVGVIIVRSGSPNSGSYRYVSNFRYTMQRATAWIALVFIFWHVFHMHGWIHAQWWVDGVAEPLWGKQFDPGRATTTAAIALGPLLVKVLYAIGVAATVFHFANGIWTMGITWGAWTTPAAQHRANIVCAVFGVALFGVGMAGLYGMSAVDLEAARVNETVRLRLEEESQRTRKRLQEELQTKQQSAAAGVVIPPGDAIAPPRAD